MTALTSHKALSCSYQGQMWLQRQSHLTTCLARHGFSLANLQKCSIPYQKKSTVITLCIYYTSIVIRHTLGHYRLPKAPAPSCMASYAHTCFSLALHQ